MRLFFLFLALAILPLSAEEENFSAQIDLSSERIHLNENLTVDILFSFPPGARVDLDAVRANLTRWDSVSIAPFVLLKEEKILEERDKLAIRFTLEPMLIGTHYISLYEIIFFWRGNKVKIMSDVLKVETLLLPYDQDYTPLIYPIISLVEQIPVEMDRDLAREIFGGPAQYDMEAAKNALFFDGRKIPWVHISALFILIAVIFIIGQYPKEKLSLRQKVAISFYRSQIEARKSLERLLRRKFVVKRGYDSVYLEIDSILKTFFAGRLRMKTGVKTTEEIIAELKRREEFNEKTIKELRLVLEKSDRIKFAGYRPTGRECAKARRVAKMIFY